MHPFAVNFVEGPDSKNTEESDTIKINEYYDWCNQHNILLNFTELKYKVGRIRLGEISQNIQCNKYKNLY